jgi:branched-chain amino acid aminotransferase
MSYVVSIDGEIVHGARAVVPVTDRGFLYGDSVYEVVRTYGGRPFALDEHLRRLRRSAEILELGVPVSDEKLAAEVRALIDASPKSQDRGVRIVLTRGSGEIGLDPALADAPRRVMISFDLPVPSPELQRHGASVVLVQTGHVARGALAGGAKTGNYLTNVLSLKRARERGAYEAIMVDADGRLAEGTTSNVFLVQAGKVSTPSLAVGILAGITRKHVIELGRTAGLVVEEADLGPAEIHSADEVFLTSTIKEILPVTRVDEAVVANGRPGPVTLRIRTLFEELTRRG